MELPSRKKRPSKKKKGQAEILRPKKRAVVGGKASARIRHFDLQRGLDIIGLVDGVPRPPGDPLQDTPAQAAKAGPTSKKKGPVGRARKMRQRLPYISSFRSKTRLQCAAPATPAPAQWEALGPEFIPKGQTYGTGGNNRPPVSGRISGVAVDPSDPNHILVASAGGGIWETNDRGGYWVAKTDFHELVLV